MNKNNVASNIDSGIVSREKLFPGNKREINIPWTKLILSLSLLATVIGALASTKILSGINKNVASAKEAARPASVKIIKITTPKCSDCFNVDNAVLSFKQQNVKVEGEKTIAFDSPEAKSLIKQFSIKKVPTYLITGEVAKNNLESFVKSNGNVKNNTFVFTNLSPIFIDPITKQENGWVTATVITDPSCTQCADPKAMVENIEKTGGVKVKDLKEFTWDSSDGQSLIDQYKITKVPTFIFSPEVDLYNNVKSVWPKLGTVEKDKNYVARNLQLPYRDLATGQIAGLVDIIYLTDSSCTECYKVQDAQKPILTKGYGVVFGSERIVDISSSEGQNLISKYNISQVPTIIMSPEADQYVNLKNVWKSVGTVGTDGWYVFTKLSQIGGSIYKDLTNNQIINPAVQTSPSPTK